MRTLKYLRLKSNMSQRQFALAIGISNSMLSRYERGKRNIKYQTAVKIANRINMPVKIVFPEFFEI